MDRLLLATACTAIFCPSAWGQSQSTATNQGSATDQARIPEPKNTTSSTSTGSEALEDIIVTAQRRSERLQNVPVAVTATTAAKLEAVGITTTQDLSLVTPGLNAPQAAGYAQPHIRGVGSSSNGPGLEQPVATYIDGVYIAAAPASLLTLNNVDRIEVLKGPQGTLFGRNATGGLIQVVTRDPRQDFSGAVNLSYGNYNDLTGDLYVTGGLTGNLAADVALRFQHQGDGWGRNLATGRKTGDLPHDFAGRAKFLFSAAEATEVRLSFDYEDRVSRRDSQHLDFQYPPTFNNPFFGGPFPQGRTFDINNEFDPRSTLRSGGASLQVNHDLGNLGLQAITAYRESRYDFTLDTDLTPRAIIMLDARTRGRQFSQELQLSSNGEGRLKWVAGAFYFFADDRNAPLDIVFGPSVVSPVPQVPVTIRADDRQRTDSIAGYGQATYEVLAGTRLTLGGRYTYENKRIDGRQDFIVAGHLAASGPVPAPGSGIPASSHFSKFSYRVALDHQFGRDVLGYVSYNTGFKSGGYNIAVPSNAPYAPETIDAVEVGLKSELFGRRLRLNGAAFHYDYSNIQVGRYTNGAESIYNGAKARIYGFDLDGELVVGGGLSLDGGVSYVHARFTEFPNADYVVPIGDCTPPPGGVCEGSAKGNALPFSPGTTFNLGLNYRRETNVGTFAFNATYFNTSRFFAAPDNIGYQPGYDLANVSLVWTDPAGRTSLRLWGRNIGDTVYATSLIEANQGLIRSLGSPRTYGITLGRKF